MKPRTTEKLYPNKVRTDPVNGCMVWLESTFQN